MFLEDIPITFLDKAAALLADTNSGLTGPQIVRAINSYGDMWHVRVPHPTYPFEAPNKRTALIESLQAFSPPQQFQIIEELCEHHSFTVGSSSGGERKKLRAELFTRFGSLRLNKEVKELDVPLIEETRHWLHGYPKSLEKLEQAKLKYDAGIFQRNLLDDLRLGLELLLKSVLENTKSLENQVPLIGAKLKERGASAQFTNMFQKLLDLYGKYQNEYVKHDDNLPEEEVEFIFELTASFMKHIVRVAG
ncbi:hypothetical protein [Sphingopyxis sp. RIFCSPHIGHO2_12_FULL_65_19]|uniref:hypothetical protein n=1 Tax=Sphingopyxis sp. RIFCSPHIGHO2_12_FULL_65_19 TaxID=1802172 RepID=UPI0008CEE142|nr:hypothetical protein [Sphingopyxis sp. RIFCSPHIGHO2_12_FULL_65_19]OHD07574.1 MAG: hypothetical protein A3E77_09335 [Sphingopyxis sp. RIFCSPHIGHO2_12_FULL_65_19]